MVKKLKGLMLLAVLGLFASAALALDEDGGLEFKPSCKGSGQLCAVETDGTRYTKGLDQ